MTRSQTKYSRKTLLKLIIYMLGNEPDEFGLVPHNGFFKIKDVLKTLSEEGNNVKVGQLLELNTIAVAEGEEPPLIFDENRISLTGAKLPEPVYEEEPPVILHTFCRKRAHAHTIEKGLAPMSSKWVVLCKEKRLAERIGQRYDADPVMLSINTDIAIDKGQIFFSFGKNLYLTEEILAYLLTIPPLPKERPENIKSASAKQTKPVMPTIDNMPGTFPLNFDPDEKVREKRERDKSKRKRQLERKQQRKNKRKDFE